MNRCLLISLVSISQEGAPGGRKGWGEGWYLARRCLVKRTEVHKEPMRG